MGYQTIEVRKLTPEEQEKQFEEDLALWEKIKTTKESTAFEDYLKRFPSGKFCELAQFRLDRLLEEGVALRLLAGQDVDGLGEFGLVGALRLHVPHDALEGVIDDERAVAARALDLKLGTQVRHGCMIIAPCVPRDC